MKKGKDDSNDFPLKFSEFADELRVFSIYREEFKSFSGNAHCQKSVVGQPRFSNFFEAVFFTDFIFGEVLQNKLALAFIIDAFLAMFLLAYGFAVKPLGKVRWYWFIVFSIVGGLGFSLPFYWWLNEKIENR